MKTYANATEPSKEEVVEVAGKYENSLSELFKAKEEKDITAAKEKMEKTHKELITVMVRKAAALRAKADKDKNNA